MPKTHGGTKTKENGKTETERLLAWLRSQEGKKRDQIQYELETLPEIDLSKALEKARMAVRSRIQALENRDSLST